MYLQSCLCLCQVVDVADDTISIRSLDWDRDRFDIEFGLQEGTTYNSFLIFGDKTCLVDASHEKFRELYMKTLKDQLAERGRTLDYVVVSHTEPDHSGEQQPQAACRQPYAQMFTSAGNMCLLLGAEESFQPSHALGLAFSRLHGLPSLAHHTWLFVAGLIPDIIDAFPHVKIAGSKVALMYLKGLTNRDFTQHPVKGGDKIDLGQGVSPEPVSIAQSLTWALIQTSADCLTRTSHSVSCLDNEHMMCKVPACLLSHGM